MAARFTLSSVRGDNNFAVLTSTRKPIGYGDQQACEKYVARKGAQTVNPGCFVQELRSQRKFVASVETIQIGLSRTRGNNQFMLLDKSRKLLGYGDWATCDAAAKPGCILRRVTEYGQGLVEYAGMIILVGVVCCVILFACAYVPWVSALYSHIIEALKLAIA